MTDSELSAAPDASALHAAPQAAPAAFQHANRLCGDFVNRPIAGHQPQRPDRARPADGCRARPPASPISVLEAQQIELRKERDYAESDAKVEQWAHSDGKMVREGEVLVIPIPGREPEITPTATPPAALVRAAAEEDKEPSWHLWWQLFFEGDPPF